MKKILFIFLMILFGGLSQAEASSMQTQPVFSGDFYQLSSSKEIYKHGTCKSLVKNGSNDVFVPLKTSAEWSAFISNSPSNRVTKTECSCLGVSNNGYTVGSIAHGSTTTSTKLVTIAHGTITKTGTFSCSSGLNTQTGESETVTCNGGYSWNGASCTPSNCSAGSINSYPFSNLLHGSNQGVNKIVNGTPGNGATSYSATASCSFGTVTISGESSSMSCNTGYSWNGSSCIALPSNCSAGSQNGYTYGPLIHANSQGVIKTVNGTPSNGSTAYSANASCNNGTVTINGETPSISCNTGYSWNGSSCIAAAPKCYETVITYDMTTDYIGTSWSYSGPKRCQSNDYWTMKSITNCSSGTPQAPLSSGGYTSSKCAYTFSSFGDYWGHFSCSEVPCAVTPPPPPSNCSAGSQNGYGYGSLTHGNSQGVSKIVNGFPTNGKTNYNATASCNNGSVNINGETSSMSCNTGYTWTGASCVIVAIPPLNCTSGMHSGFFVPALNHGGNQYVTKTPVAGQPSSGMAYCNNGVVTLVPNAPSPFNCTSGSQNGYSYGSLNHGQTEGVSKLATGTPLNGTTSYTATATCNNGTINITGELSNISCYAKHRLSGGSCIPMKRTQICTPGTCFSVGGTPDCSPKNNPGAKLCSNLGQLCIGKITGYPNDIYFRCD